MGLHNTGETNCSSSPGKLLNNKRRTPQMIGGKQNKVLSEAVYYLKCLMSTKNNKTCKKKNATISNTQLITKVNKSCPLGVGGVVQW